MEFLRKYWVYLLAAVAIVAVVILLLVLHNARTKAREEEGRKIISEAERDSLTNLYNLNFFLVYANRLYREHPDKPMDAVVLNIDRFHSVNALHGREFGDRVLQTLGDEIQSFLSETEGIAGRGGADRFDIYCLHREDWQTQLERFQAKLDGLLHDANIHLRMGVKPWQKGVEPVMQFDRARTACNKVRGDYNSRAVIYDEVMGLQEEKVLYSVDKSILFAIINK